MFVFLLPTIRKAFKEITKEMIEHTNRKLKEEQIKNVFSSVSVLFCYTYKVVFSHKITAAVIAEVPLGLGFAAAGTVVDGFAWALKLKEVYEF